MKINHRIRSLKTTLHQPSTKRACLFATTCTIMLCIWMASSGAQSPPKKNTQHITKKFKHNKRKAGATSIYPAKSKHIKFSHEKHKATDCTTCHVMAINSSKTSDMLEPNMSVCASCHDGKTAKPALNQCGACHVGYKVTSKQDIKTSAQWQAVRPAPMPIKRQQANIKFNHKAHLKHSTSKAMTTRLCVQCHTGQSPTLPAAQQCASCHNGQAQKDTCQTCHLQMRSGLLKTTFAQSSSGKKQTLKPDNHTVNWIKRHGAIAKTQADTCMSCHAQTTCTSCHQQQNAIPRTVHPPNFLTIHRVAAKSQQANCTTCHQQQTFCTSCHVRTKSTMRVAAKPPSTKRVHPPGWLNRASAKNHGVMAKQNINDCASCHQEQDCLSCHRGISPHAPNFASNCKRALKANPQPCLKCHQSTTLLTGQCR